MYTSKEHEDVINNLIKFLNVEGVNQAEVSLLIQNLRNNYSEVDTTVNDNSKEIQSFKDLNEGLRSANMQLLSQLGTQSLNVQDKDKLINERNNSNQSQEKDEEIMSLDDVAKSFL